DPQYRGDTRMIDIRRGDGAANSAVIVVTLRAVQERIATVDPTTLNDQQLVAELQAYVSEVEHQGAAGVVHVLSRPSRKPAAVLRVGSGDGDETGWRAAGAGIVRAASTRWGAVHIDTPADITPAGLRGLAEGAALASYRFRLAADKNGSAPKLRRVT